MMRVLRAILIATIFGSTAFAVDPAAEDAAMTARIDALVAGAWKAAGVTPARPATDAEFLRRATIDFTGSIPRVSETRTFLDDRSPDKLTRLIDELLQRPAHPSHLADVWGQILLPDTAIVDDVGASAFESWLRSAFAGNRPYAEMVRELLLATGSAADPGPALYYTALEVKPEKLAASTSRTFLGMQIQCAECHNHPFDKWTQRDFWGYAAFFARVSGERAGMGATVVADRPAGEVMIPDKKDVVPARFLLGEAAKDESGRTRRSMLAEWMTSAKNPYFAKAAVNRVWAQLFGRGIIDPPDDLRDDQRPPLAEALSELSAYFIRTNYDLRRLFAVIGKTRAYRLASELSPEKERPPELFAVMPLKALSAEQFYNCVAIATCRPYDGILANVPSSRARRALTNRTAFVNSFRAPSAQATEYTAGIPQALMLLNGRLVDDATDLERSDLLSSLDAPFLTDRDRVETLFLAVLSRRPSSEILAKFEKHLASQPSAKARYQALGDMLWALLNSAEFAFNH